MAETRLPLPDAARSFDRLLAWRAEQAADGRALGGMAPAEYEAPLSWLDFHRQAGAAAAWLADHGIGRGDRVAMWGQTSLAWAVWLAAAAWRGAALVAIHPNFGRDDLAAALRQSEVKWLIADEAARGVRLAETARAAAATAAIPGVTILPGGDGRFDLAPMLDGAGPVPAMAGAPDLPLNIQFTSGSTGAPKAVLLSHRALMQNAAMTAAATGIGAGDRIAAPLPLFHSAGLSTGLVLSAVVDATWVGIHRFQTGPALETINRRACTVFQGVPTMYDALLGMMAEDGIETPSLRVGIIGGAFLPPDLCARITRMMGLEHLGMVYGQTETGPTVSVTRGDEPPALVFTTAGPPLPGVSVRIRDPDTGADMPDGEVGEIVVRTPTLMDGYYGDPEATRAAILPDGWIRTGDLGRLKEGCIQVTARLKDLIIRGGENISPYQVEETLLAAPGVANVCVVPVPSSRWGEAICAVVSGPAADDIDLDVIREHADGHLPRHMRPDHYLVRMDMPLLPNGKVDRHRVQKDAAAETSGMGTAETETADTETADTATANKGATA